MAAAAPATSMRRVVRWPASPTRQPPMPSVITATGRLTKNASRHDQRSTSQPPTSGPVAEATLPNADQVPIALPRAAPSKVVPSRARLAGTNSAAAAPCAARAASSCPSVRARPQPSDAAREQRHAGEKEPAVAEPIAQRATDQDERGQRQQVRRDRPLRAGRAGAELARQTRNRDVHDRGIDKRQARPEDRRDERPSPVTSTTHGPGGAAGTRSPMAVVRGPIAGMVTRITTNAMT